MGKNGVGGILTSLRVTMKNNGITHYLASDADPHMSEYVNAYYKVRTFLSGFTGSNGTILVTNKEAYLWTDGRYFVQAENELKGSGIKLMKMGQKGVPTISEFLDKNVKKGDCIGFDGYTTSVYMGKKLQTIADRHGASVKYDVDIVSSIWEERPLDNASLIYTLPSKCHGENATSKIERVRRHLKEKGADYILISKLDDQMWLFNIRANDIECNPVCYAYTLIGVNSNYICIKNEALNDKAKKYFEKNNVSVIEYSKLKNLIKKAKGKVLIDENSSSYGLYCQVQSEATIIAERNITEKMKAIKNETEIANLKECYLKDSVVLTRFIKYIKEVGAKTHISEYEAAKLLDDMRAGIDDFIELSFPTISAYGANAAMMHYECSENNEVNLRKEGLYLVDSGGQYMSGTTDVTRTIVLGKLNAKMKMHYTKVAIGMLRLMYARFLYGCTGQNLDILARGPLWDIDVDYKCGTGHGIGYILNVHEGPQNIRYAKREGEEEIKLESGMIVSDEPGVYIKNEYGIRTENILLCRKGNINNDGQFMHFESLTMVPIDLDGIDVRYMNDEDIRMLNDYHKSVYNTLKPYMSKDELRWLKDATKAVRK